MPLSRPFGKVILGLGVAVIALAGYMGVALLLGARITDPSLILALVFGLTFLITLPIFLVFSTLALSVMRRVAGGDYLVHWTYTQAEWERFTEESWRRALRLDGWAVGGFALVLFILAIASGSEQLLLMALIVVGVLALVVFGRDYRLYAQRRKQGAGEVLIGRGGILRPEGFLSLAGLESVKLEYGIIRFRCRSRTYQQGASGTRYTTYDVPVPSGHEAEAAHLVALFQHFAS